MGHWYETTRADPAAVQLYGRHYSARVYHDGRVRRQICPPGQSMVLLTAGNDALWVWSRSLLPRKDGQQGVNCSVFRNESGLLSSSLIREADELAWGRWPGSRLFTYVDAGAVRSVNAGYCFKVAGWRVCGRSRARGLLILEYIPA